MANQLARMIAAVLHIRAFLSATPVIFNAARDFFLYPSANTLEQVDFLARLARSRMALVLAVVIAARKLFSADFFAAEISATLDPRFRFAA